MDTPAPPFVPTGHTRSHRLGGLVLLALVGGDTLVLAPWRGARFGAWGIAFVAFGAAFLLATPDVPTGTLRTRLLLLLAQSASVVAMVAFLCNGYEGTLLALVAMQLAPAVGARAGLAWVCAQWVALAAAIAFHWSPRAALAVAPPYLGLTFVAFLAYRSLHREAVARARLATANGELRALHLVLEESARASERASIARELHDSLGSHLTALSLTLERAAHGSEGDTRDFVRAAQSLARLLLADVHEAVSDLRADRGVGLGDAVRELARGFPSPTIHVADDEGLRLDDPRRAHVLVRSAQELITNAARHSGARNLWLTLRGDGPFVELAARDDGGGAAEVTPGLGLTGLRERLEGCGGRLQLESRPGAGFSAVVRLPREGPPA